MTPFCSRLHVFPPTGSPSPDCSSLVHFPARTMLGSEAGSWGELRRVGGTESADISSNFPLRSPVVSFGRVTSKANEMLYVLPLPYLSSVHFAVSMEEVSEGMLRYSLKSLGRNGTFVNSTLVPINTSITIMPGDNVNIMFKGEEKLKFQFISHLSAPPQVDVTERSQTQDRVEESSLIRIKELEEENRLLRLNNSAHVQRIDTMTQDIAALQTSQQELRTKALVLEGEKSDLSVEVMDLNAALAAVDAKRVHLESVVAELSSRVEELRGTIAAQEKLSSQSTALAERVKSLEHETVLAQQNLAAKQLSLDETNATLELERSAVTRLKGELKALTADLASHQMQQRTQQAVNDALQDVIVQNEDTMAQIQVRQPCRT